MILYTKRDKLEIIVDDDFDMSILDTHFISVCGGRIRYAVLVSKSDSTQVLLHRYIMNPGTDMVVDHINNNSLDNRIENLRVCTMDENCQNRRLYKNSKSGYKGVKWHSRNNCWMVQVGSKPRFHVGVFESKHDAALAYDAAAIQIYGEYAHLNIIGKEINE